MVSAPPRPRDARARLPSALIFLGALLGLVLGAPPSARALECAKVHNVVITHIFEPGDVYVEAGDCVRFVNEHVIEHSAVGMDREFNTGILMPGGTSLVRFDEVGSIPYNCGVHPPMVGVFVIEPPGTLTEQ